MDASALRRQRAASLPRSRRLLSAFGDERLVDQIRRGNDAAFEVVYDRHHRGILSFCRHMLGSPQEAEDAVQQTFASAYADLRANAREIHLKAWLYTIARNRCLSMLRSRREQPAEIDAVATAGLSHEVEARDDLRELVADLRKLPDDQREALVLFELGDLSHAEVARVIGVEPVKVKALVFQARSTLIENREARSIPCTTIREQLATATGGALRRGPLRRHLKACPGCSEYRDQVRAQRRALALVLPVVPTVGLRESVLAALGVGGGGAGGAGAAAGAVALGGSGGVAGSGVLAAVGGLGGAKLALAAAVAAGGIAGGGLAVERATHDRAPVVRLNTAVPIASGPAAKPPAPARPVATPTSHEQRDQDRRAKRRERRAVAADRASSRRAARAKGRRGDRGDRRGNGRKRWRDTRGNGQGERENGRRGRGPKAPRSRGGDGGGRQQGAAEGRGNGDGHDGDGNGDGKPRPPKPPAALAPEGGDDGKDRVPQIPLLPR